MKKRLIFICLLVLCAILSFAVSTPEHYGQTRIMDGGKYVSGWTNWLDVYHYTRAILEGYDDSGRCWGWHFTGASAFGLGLGAVFAHGTTHYGN